MEIKRLLIIVLSHIVMRLAVFVLGLFICIIGLIAPEAMMDTLENKFNEN